MILKSLQHDYVESLPVLSEQQALNIKILCLLVIMMIHILVTPFQNQSYGVKLSDKIWIIWE